MPEIIETDEQLLAWLRDNQERHRRLESTTYCACGFDAAWIPGPEEEIEDCIQHHVASGLVHDLGNVLASDAVKGSATGNVSIPWAEEADQMREWLDWRDENCTCDHSKWPPLIDIQELEFG